MRIIEEAFAVAHNEGREGWMYRICVGHLVGAQERKLYCKRWYSVHDAGGFWWEDRAQNLLRDERKRLFEHIQERGELDNGTFRMRPAPVKERRVWVNEAHDSLLRH